VSLLAICRGSWQVG